MRASASLRSVAIGTRVFDRAEMAERGGRGGDFQAFFGRELRRQRSANRPALSAAVLVDQPEQRFVGEREERAAQHAGQADFVGRAGDGAEQIQHVVDFLLGVEGVAADEVVVETVFAEGFLVQPHVAECAEQDGDVARLGAARLARCLCRRRAFRCSSRRTARGGGGRCATASSRRAASDESFAVRVLLSA